MMRGRAGLCLILLLVLTACGKQPGQDWLKGETGTVTRVLDGDTLALNTGQVVRLVSVEAPRLGSRDREADPFAEESKELLESLALGRKVQLYYPGMTQDRYERALAQVYVSNETGDAFWLNEALVQAGAVWVRIYDDTANGSGPLKTAERAVRQSRLGLWASSSPEVSANIAKDYEGRFAIVSGSLAFKTQDEDSCQYALRPSGLSVHYDELFGDCLTSDAGQTYEIRGWVNHGTLYVGSRENVELLNGSD